MKLTPVGPRQADRGPFADPVLRAGPRAGRYRRGGRHHRHPQPRHAARRRHADRDATRCASPACPTSRPRSCAAWCSTIRPRPSSCRKALDDLAEEGVIQVFYPEIGAQWIVGVVGQLQLEVLISRLEAEYKVEAGLEAPFATARWISADDAALKASPISTARRTSPRTATATRLPRELVLGRRLCPGPQPRHQILCDARARSP